VFVNRLSADDRVAGLSKELSAAELRIAALQSELVAARNVKPPVDPAAARAVRDAEALRIQCVAAQEKAQTAEVRVLIGL